MRNDQLAKELKRNYTASFCPLPWNIAIWPLAHFGPCWLNILRMLLSFCRIDYCHLVLWMLLQAEYCRIMCKTQPKWYNYSVDLVKIWDTHTHTVTLCHFYLSIFSWRWKTFGPRHNLPIDHVLLFTSRPQPWLKNNPERLARHAPALCYSPLVLRSFHFATSSSTLILVLFFEGLIHVSCFDGFILARVACHTDSCICLVDTTCPNGALSVLRRLSRSTLMLKSCVISLKT